MTSIFQARQKKLQALLRESPLDGLVLNPGSDLHYLTGLDFHLMERPVLAIFPAEGDPGLILPELEGEKISSLPFSVRSYVYSEDRSTWSGVIRDALQALSLKSARLGVNPERLRLLESSYLQEENPEVALIPAQFVLSQLRQIKDEQELDLMREAVRIAECALAAVINSIRPGISEKELAAMLVGRLLHAGSDPDLPFQPVVSFGENAANPHATPADRELGLGDLILIDWGARAGGYCSDITRVFAMGDLRPELEKIHQFVRDANQAAREEVKPGIPVTRVDQAARSVIEGAGYGEYFIHRTGHGLGLDVHEQPYISQFEETILEPGMTFTIEPGIYLPNRGGVRIEDDILVTDIGGISLTQQPRELAQLLIEE